MDDNLGKDVGIDDVADVVVVSRWTQSDEAYDDNRNESMVYCQIVARSLRMVNIHKARSKYGQELDTPVEPGVEAPYQGERKCPQQCLNEEADCLHDDPSQVLEESACASIDVRVVLPEPRHLPTAQRDARARRWKSMSLSPRLHSG